MKRYHNVVFKYKNNLIIKPPCADFDKNYTNSFKKDFSDLLDSIKHRVIILDFANVNLIDESGLATLVNVWHSCSEREIDLIFCNLNDLSLVLLHNKGLDTLIQITTNLTNAIKLGNYYSRKMEEFCKNYTDMQKVFGSNSNDTIPAACLLIQNTDESKVTRLPEHKSIPIAI